MRGQWLCQCLRALGLGHQEAGRRLRGWYDNDRILARDVYALSIGS